MQTTFALCLLGLFLAVPGLNLLSQGRPTIQGAVGTQKSGTSDSVQAGTLRGKWAGTIKYQDASADDRLIVQIGENQTSATIKLIDETTHATYSGPGNVEIQDSTLTIHFELKSANRRYAYSLKGKLAGQWQSTAEWRGQLNMSVSAGGTFRGSVKASFVLNKSSEEVDNGNTEEEGPSPDRWHGLILDETTPEEALRILGTPPSSDRLESFSFFAIGGWISDKRKEQIFRTLFFKKFQDFDVVRLSFLRVRLVNIFLVFGKKNKISATQLTETYPGLRFSVFFPWIFSGPGQTSREQGVNYVKEYPEDFTLGAKGPHSFVEAQVRHSAIYGVQTGQIPGEVTHLSLVSRTLESTKTKNILK